MQEDTLTDYNYVKLTPTSEKLLKITRYYDRFNDLKNAGRVNSKISFIIGLLLEREWLYKQVIIQLCKGLCLQEGSLLQKNRIIYYTTYYRNVKRLNNLLKEVKTIDIILFSEMGENYIEWLKEEFTPKELVVCELYKNILWAVYLWDGGGYYFISYIYKEGVEGVKKMLRKHYELLQLLSGELCLGHGESFKRRCYVNIKKEWVKFINEMYGSCNKHSIGDDLYVFYFKNIGQEYIDAYREICDFEVKIMEYGKIENFIIPWDNVLLMMFE
jgi:hypothetical protein